MPSLKLTMEEDDFGINHFLDKTFYLLRDFLQPDTNLTLDITTQSILDSLSKQDAKSQETSLFGDLCVQLAERIPYHHASLMKMVALLERLAEPTKFTTANAMGEYLKFSGFGIDFRDALHGPDRDNPMAYVNFHAVAAHLFECHCISSTRPTWAMWALRDALEGYESGHDVDPKLVDKTRDVLVLAAAQWILWYGQSLFAQILFPGDVSQLDLQYWTPGPLCNGTAYLSLDRWHFWRDGLNAMASAGGDEEKQRYSQECMSVAAEAAALMESMEGNMTFST